MSLPHLRSACARKLAAQGSSVILGEVSWSILRFVRQGSCSAASGVRLHEATAYDRAIQPKHVLSKVEGTECPNAGKQGDDKGEDGKDSSASAGADRQLRTDAGVRPLDVDDKKTSLEDKLKDGFMAAYRERVGAGKSN